ncbi:MAG: response regulator [Rhodocyclaceae bacterium]|nr:response regulator [Rhodocyclaceae bacterium]
MGKTISGDSSPPDEEQKARHKLEEELEASRRAAEAANLAKSRFLANMSHEIRTPLNAIVGLSHLMLEDETDPRQLQRLKRIATSAQHLLALLNDILDLSKIEAGQLKLEKIDFALNDVLDLVRVHIEERIAARPIHFRLSIAPDVPALLHGDPLRLGQILLNYASNAVKFTSEGSITLAVTRLSSTDEAVRLRFELSDTGIGFDEGMRARLFRPFEQADLSTTRQYGGTGLGLAICKELADLMGGRVGADSVPGVGSTFWLEVSFAPPALPTAATTHFAPLLKGRRLLIVGRKNADSEQLSKFAEEFGMRCYRCANGREALARVRTAAEGRAPYDFLIFHGAAHEADRLLNADELKELKAIEPAPRRVFATRLTEAIPEGEPALRHRFDTLLPLPTTASQFYEMLAETLEEETPTQTPPQPASPAESTPCFAGRVLLVEDNPINREVAIDILASAGLVPTVARDGAEALELAEANDFDLILMDIQMPVMDGLVATRAIRALPRHAKTPIVAMTANAFEEDRRQCFAAGMDDYLAKPVTPAALKAKLKRWLMPAAAAPAAPAAPLPTPPLPDFRSIPGLDAEAGLVAVMGRPERYVKLLGKFALHHANDITALRQALAAGNQALAHRLAHTLKGTAAVLGAKALSQAAREADELIKSEGSEAAIAAALDLLEERLAALIGRLEPFRPFAEE